MVIGIQPIQWNGHKGLISDFAYLKNVLMNFTLRTKTFTKKTPTNSEPAEGSIAVMMIFESCNTDCWNNFIFAVSEAIGIPILFQNAFVPPDL